MVERLVICGGLPTTKAGTQNSIELDVSAPDRSAQRVNLKLGDLSARMVEDVPLVLTDLIEIAAYVYCADQFTSRGGEMMSGMGKDWSRSFRFRDSRSQFAYLEPCGRPGNLGRHPRLLVRRPVRLRV